MNNSIVADAHPFTDNSRITWGHVNHRTILNIGPIANSDAVHIAPDDRLKPY